MLFKLLPKTLAIAGAALASIFLPVCEGAEAGLPHPSAREKMDRGLQDMPDASKNNITDLSQSLAPAELYNSNTGAMALLELAENEPEIRGLVVVEQGEIVAEYYRDGIEPSTLSPIHSCTKSWISLLLGVMEKNGLISLNETLGDIWPDNNTWENVDHADYRRSVNIQSLLTMTAGLKMRFFAWFDLLNPPWMGGGNLVHALEYHAIDQSLKGQFVYSYWINLFSYIIQKRTGLNAEEYAAQQVFPQLGITDQDYKWDANFEGEPHSGFGLHMTVKAMAKLGMLYLQNGKAGESVNVVGKDWIDKSTRGGEGHPFYGYLWYVDVPEQVYCASGFGGQKICVDKYNDRVLAMASDNYLAAFLGSPSAVIDLVHGLSFSEPI